MRESWEASVAAEGAGVSSTAAAPTPPRSCDRRMRGLYGAVTVCSRPRGHVGKHDPIYNAADWAAVSQEPPS